MSDGEPRFLTSWWVCAPDCNMNVMLVIHGLLLSFRTACEVRFLALLRGQLSCPLRCVFMHNLVCSSVTFNSTEGNVLYPVCLQLLKIAQCLCMYVVSSVLVSASCTCTYMIYVPLLAQV